MDDHDQIRQVLAAYCQTCDDGDFETWGRLFTNDATFTVLGETHRGRDVITAWIAAAQPPEARGQHMISQPVIEVDSDTAEVATDYVFIAADDTGLPVTSAGRYLDRFERHGDTWRISARTIRFLGD